MILKKYQIQDQQLHQQLSMISKCKKEENKCRKKENNNNKRNYKIKEEVKLTKN